jgi:hypothetical protein
MNISRTKKEIGQLRVAAKKAEALVAKSGPLAVSAHESHRAAKLVAKAARKAARGAKKQWHSTRDKARRDTVAHAALVRKLVKLEKKLAAATEKARKEAKPTKAAKVASKPATKGGSKSGK